MFRHFTPRARDIVAHAQHEAIRLRHNYIGKEHLLLAIAAERAGVAAEVLHALGGSHEAVEKEVVRIIGRGPAGPLDPSDAEALETIGIDLDEVRSRVEAAFGPGALDSSTPGCVPFTPKAKEALELALRESKALGDGAIRTEHLLLGVVRSSGGAGAEVLRALGIDPRTVRAMVVERLARAS